MGNCHLIIKNNWFSRTLITHLHNSIQISIKIIYLYHRLKNKLNYQINVRGPLIIGPWNLFRDLCFRSRPTVRLSVRPSVRDLFFNRKTNFLTFFLMDSSWEGAKTYRARFLNFSFFAPVKVQKHLFFVLFFKFLKNRVVKFFYFLIFYSSRRAGHFCFLFRDRSGKSSPWKWAKTPVFVHF